MTLRLNLESFEKLFKDNYHYLLLISYQVVGDRETAQDIVQEFYINFWEKRRFDNIENFKSYATRAVKNLSISHLRKALAIQNKIDGFIDALPRVELDELSKQQIKENAKEKSLFVNDLVQRLPEKRRQIFLAFVVGGLSYEQISKEYNISINTVKTQLRRSYKFLKSNVEDHSLDALLLTILLPQLLNTF